jgi:hypothetical protein
LFLGELHAPRDGADVGPHRVDAEEDALLRRREEHHADTGEPQRLQQVLHQEQPHDV